MSKSARDRFQESMENSRRNTKAVQDFVVASFTKRSSYAFASGALEHLLKDALFELPLERQAEFRRKLEILTSEEMKEAA